MELNWSTFLLEIFNFLVLVWILKRFLYQPALDIIARRRAMIENKLADAEQHHAQANTLKQQYDNRLADWEQERQKAREALKHEIEKNRLHQLENLNTELAQEDEKNRVTRSQQDKQLKREIEQRALQQGAKFASRLLAEVAGPELETRLFNLLLDGLTELSADQINRLSNKWEASPEHIQVTSAYPLGDDERHRLEEILCRIMGQPVPLHYDQDAKLLAGLHITIGAWALQLNVRDELRGFKELVHVEG